MPSYTLDELLKIMEPQAQRDKALINQCIEGLGLYAAQQARSNSFSSKPDEMRKLAENLVSYWGLDDGQNAPQLEDFLEAFDDKIIAAKSGEEISGNTYRRHADTIYGLHRYGEEMVVAQGSDAMSDILDMGDLMEELAVYWEFDPYDAVTELAGRLRTEVKTMLAEIPLPGQPESGKCAGYEIKQAIVFNDGRGFALAHNPDAPLPFVTWQFTEENGVRDYYWGKYLQTEERGRLSYLSRSTDHMETYKVTERPTTAVEVNAEQNYNMIDGVHNNEGVPKPDLTDGQTFEEIRELAPEMLPDETANDNQPIPAQVLSEGQPLVTVTFSEDEQLRGIVRLPLYLANTLFFEADERQSMKYFAVLHSAEPIAPYLKTDFRVDFTMNSEPGSYSGRYDVGDGDGTLTEHIQGQADYYRNDEDHQEYLENKGEKETANAQYDTILDELVPFFEKHCELSKMEEWALTEIRDINVASSGQLSDADQQSVVHYESIVEKVHLSRSALNHSEIDSLPEFLSVKSEKAEAELAPKDKPSVLAKIKAARTTPKTPSKPKPEHDKKKQEPEL